MNFKAQSLFFSSYSLGLSAAALDKSCMKNSLLESHQSELKFKRHHVKFSKLTSDILCRATISSELRVPSGIVSPYGRTFPALKKPDTQQGEICAKHCPATLPFDPNFPVLPALPQITRGSWSGTLLHVQTLPFSKPCQRLSLLRRHSVLPSATLSANR